MSNLESFVSNLASFLWGLPLLIILVGGGLYLLIYSRLIQFKYFFHAIDILRGKFDNDNDTGEISHFSALSTALSATVGMGNIAGVAVAISIGGPGAIFWMWISGVIGMSTKFFTSSLSIMYRGYDSEGKIQGGPMYFITEGLGKKWKPLAIMFSLSGLLGVLPLFNVNQLTQAINDILLIPAGIQVNVFSNILIGFVLILLTSIVILGGLKRISLVATRLVPFMVAIYMLSVVLILIINYDVVPYYLKLIFTDAFSADFYKGDSLYGGVVGALIILGIRRGAFSNEAGIGTAPLAHGAAKTNSPVKEGLVAMLGPAIDTLLVCTLTALAILVTGVWKDTGLDGVSLTASAFSHSLTYNGQYILLFCILVFSMSSLFTYSYYGTKCMSFLFGVKYKNYYNYIFIFSIMLGATTSLSLMINLIDTFFALMAIPTMLATIMLSHKVITALKEYKNSL
ncbi:MAG: alanine:cation symporter family protein [Flavobacteriaceae bacterium]|jgi:AGCS family alanine or glycine:cation symporter|nr:alanine:cation symporter family protein [Flavobacteriaceae bacterium]